MKLGLIVSGCIMAVAAYMLHLAEVDRLYIATIAAMGVAIGLAPFEHAIATAIDRRMK